MTPFFLLIQALVEPTVGEDWTAVERGVFIDHALEETPLEIRTNTDLYEGGGEQVTVWFYSAEGKPAGGLDLHLKTTNTALYRIPFCTDSYTEFPFALPLATNKVWQITLTRTTGIKLQIHCNEEEMLSVVLSDTVCASSRVSQRNWSVVWNRTVERIKFQTSDLASDCYRPYRKPPCAVSYIVREEAAIKAEKIFMENLSKGWRKVIRDKELNFNLETIPLEIQTNFEVGKDCEEKMHVLFLDAEGVPVGGVDLHFKSTNTVQYRIFVCTVSYTDLPVSLPSGTNEKVWRITLSRTPHVKLQIHCDGVEVLDFQLSDTACYEWNESESVSWSSFWSYEVKKITFTSLFDDASDFYRPYGVTEQRGWGK